MRQTGATPDPGVEANARLTGSIAVVLLALLAADFATGLIVRRVLLSHVLIGFRLIPAVLLKLGSVGYRFVRYYTGDRRFRIAGPPRLLARLLGPVSVLLTIVVFGTGLELWLFGYRFGFVWAPLHHASSYLWFAAMAVHVITYWRRVPQLALADWRDHLGGAVARRSLVVGSLLLGAVLAIALLPFPTPFALPSGGG